MAFRFHVEDVVFTGFTLQVSSGKSSLKEGKKRGKGTSKNKVGYIRNEKERKRREGEGKRKRYSDSLARAYTKNVSISV